VQVGVLRFAGRSFYPQLAKIATDSSVEMSWRVFGGEYHEIYLALLKDSL
jgi:DNA sulfur modification protein DndE